MVKIKMSVAVFKELLNENCHPPLVFHHAINRWPARLWTEKYLAKHHRDKQFQCKISPRDYEEVLIETDCLHIQCSLWQYEEWLSGQPGEDNPLSVFDPTKYSAYIDYKYMKEVFAETQEVLKELSWENFGFPGRDGADCTLWIGSTGAYTPCHQDTYGFNLVAQIKGRKRWYLFPPSASCCMYPTRLPFEESSVFSEVNVRYPDLRKYPLFQKAKPHIVILQPGEVLYVPRHWWHFVECLEPSISVNTWVEMKEDIDTHLEEAVTRFLFTSMSSLIPGGNLLNSYEELESPDINIQYIQQAIEAVVEANNGKQQNDLSEKKPLATRKSPAEPCCTPQSVDNFQKFIEAFKGYEVTVSEGDIERICACRKSQSKRKRLHSSSVQDRDSLSEEYCLNTVSKYAKHECQNSQTENQLERSNPNKTKLGVESASIVPSKSTKAIVHSDTCVCSKPEKNLQEEQVPKNTANDQDVLQICTVPELSFKDYLDFLKAEFDYDETVDISSCKEHFHEHVGDESIFISQTEDEELRNAKSKELNINIMNSILDHSTIGVICHNLLEKYRY